MQIANVEKFYHKYLFYIDKNLNKTVPKQHTLTPRISTDYATYKNQHNIYALYTQLKVFTKDTNHEPLKMFLLDFVPKYQKTFKATCNSIRVTLFTVMILSRKPTSFGPMF